MSRGRAAALLVGGAALEAAAFPPFALWPLAFVMLAPVAAFAEGESARRAFLFAWLEQWLAGVLVTHWLLHALLVEYEAPVLPSVAFLVIVVGGYALVPAAAVALYARLRPRLPVALAPLVFAAFFALAEWLRSEPLYCPWVVAAHPVAFVPLLVQGAALGGTTLVSFWLVAIGAGLGIALRARSAVPLAAPAGLAAAALGAGALALAQPDPSGAKLRVGVVQAAVPQSERFHPGSALRNTKHHVELTRKMTAERPVDLVVWSETSVDDDLDLHPELKELLRATAAEAGVPLVTGAPRSAGGRRTNSVVVFDGSGLRGSYDKQLLVPFAESDPPGLGFLGALIGPVTAGDPYVPGREPRVFDGPIPFATPICFEIVDPRILRAFHAAGARLVLNLSNDAWFGRTGYPEMNLAHAVFRAVELRTWVLRGTNTGVSAAIDPAGRVRDRLGLLVEGSFVVDVGPPGPETLFARFGPAPFLGTLVLGVALAAGLGARSAGRASPRPGARSAGAGRDFR